MPKLAQNFVRAAHLCVFAVTLSAWTPQASASLLVTTAPLADLVGEVSCQKLTADVLVARGTDPHSFALTPGLRAKLATATHVVRVSPLYEHWLKSDAVRKKNVLVILDASDSDPHFWNSPERTKQAARQIAAYLDTQKLVEPTKARECLVAFEKKADATFVRLKAKMETLPAERRTIATTHDALGLFAEAFGLKIEPILGLNSEGAPTPQRLRAIVSAIRSRKVHALFVESTSSRRVAESVARDAGIQVGGELIVDSLAPLGKSGDTILGAWTHNVETIAAALAP